MGYSYIPLNERDKAEAATLARQLRISPVVVEILFRRGVTNLEALREYLFPQLADLPDPFLLRGMQAAVARIVEARLAGHPLYIHGDYDVDGITATALLQGFFAEVGLRSSYYIPNRLEESYGLSEASLARLLEGARAQDRPVLVTVDCGISSRAEVALARERYGCDVIVTDHHLPGPELPDATAIINQKQPGCAFPYKHLAGVGVAFFLILALRRALVEAGVLDRERMPNLKQHMDLVALGSIADVVPLTGVNRTLVRAGLEVLGTRKRPGVAALAQISRVMTAVMTADDVAFRFAPRINAGGRLGQPELGVRLLLARDPREARRLAAQLEGLNRRRKMLESGILPEIAAECMKQAQEGRAALSVYNPDCHPGVLGILASRMAERFERPVILFTIDRHDGDTPILKGSGRSVPEVNLHETLAECAEVIEQFGGHPMAAGLTVSLDKLEQFGRLFHESVLRQQDEPGGEHPQLPVDYQLAPEHLLQDGLMRNVQLMEPCGEGNPEPIFLMQSEALQGVRRICNDEHLVFSIEVQGQSISGVGFNLARRFPTLADQETSLVFKLKQRYANRQESPQMQVIEFLPGER